MYSGGKGDKPAEHIQSEFCFEKKTSEGYAPPEVRMLESSTGSEDPVEEITGEEEKPLEPENEGRTAGRTLEYSSTMAESAWYNMDVYGEENLMEPEKVEGRSQYIQDRARQV